MGILASSSCVKCLKIEELSIKHSFLDRCCMVFHNPKNISANIV